MKKKMNVKTPPRGGDAAAAWEHNLKPGEKEELARQYREAGEKKLRQGRNTVLLIAAVNAVLAVASVFTGFDAIPLCIRLLMCIALFFALPGIKILFPAGAAICIVMISGAWGSRAGPEAFVMVFNILESASLVISSIILLISENVAEYLYAKRNG